MHSSTRSGAAVVADRQASTGLRILLQNRPDVYQRPGGDTAQTEQTLAFLRREGHDARLSLELSPDLSAVDVVHLFNLTTPLETYIQARKRGRHDHTLLSVTRVLGS